MHNAIQVSGGIDSLALLFNLRGLWDDSIVMWGDTGAAYHDVETLMDDVRQLVPHFLHVRGDQPGVTRQVWLAGGRGAGEPHAHGRAGIRSAADRVSVAA